MMQPRLPICPAKCFLWTAVGKKNGREGSALECASGIAPGGIALWLLLPLKHDIGPHGVLEASGDLGARVVDVVLEDEHVACPGRDADRSVGVVGVEIDEGGVPTFVALRALLILSLVATVRVGCKIVFWTVAKISELLVQSDCLP